MSLKICKSKVIFNIISFLLKKQTSVSMSSVTSEKSFKFIDIGANLTDPVYQGIYNGSTKHEADLKEVLTRAYDNGLEKLIITGGNLEDSKAALKLAEQKNCLYCTVGCHPTRCQDFEKSNPEEYLQQLKSLAAENKSKVVAVGECGLDYERLHFCPKEIQQKYFEWQFEIAEATNLPMFLHCRNSVEDLLNIIQKNRDRFSNGVVHSFDGNAEEAKAIIDLGLYIGINGCSLKTPENLEVVSKIPIDRLMIETDCPWCEIRPTHAGYKYIKTTYPSKKKEKWESGFLVKSRNEPVNIVQVLEVLAAVLEEDSHSLAEIIYENTNKVFFSK